MQFLFYLQYTRLIIDFKEDVVMFVRDIAIRVVLAVLSVVAFATFYIAIENSLKWKQSENYVSATVVDAEINTLPVPCVSYTYSVDGECFDGKMYGVFMKDVPQNVYIDRQNCSKSFLVEYKPAANWNFWKYVILASIVLLLFIVAWYGVLTM